MTMTKQQIEISVRGKTVRVPATRIGVRTVVVSGRFLRIATVHDSDFVDGEAVQDPAVFIAQMKGAGVDADILTFPQKIYQEQPLHPYAFEWDNAAVAPTASFTTWWEALPQVVRKNVRRSAKRGVSVDVVSFDDEFVRGVKGIYDESPVRQGRRFWHFGKDLERVRLDNSSYLERSEFIGAYFEGELIGFAKLVYADKAAIIMQIVCKVAHNDKRPMNALIAKAVEVCEARGILHLVYSKFTYGNKTGSEIAEFKRRNGFVQMNYPRYFVPLTIKGRIAFAMKLHRGVAGLLPSGVINSLLSIRAKWLDTMIGLRSPVSGQPAPVLPSGPGGQEVE
jgi:hypothetical protein